MKTFNKKYLVGMTTLAALLSIAGAAQAAPYMKFCTHWRSQYTDSGMGEDIFNSTGVVNRDAEYAFARVYDYGLSKWIWDGQLDGDGCSPFLKVSSNTRYRLAQGTAAGRKISGQWRRIYVNRDGYSYGQSWYTVNNDYVTGSLSSTYYQKNFYPSLHSRHTNMMPIAGKVLNYYSSRNYPNGTDTYIQTAYNSSSCPIGSYRGGGNVCVASTNGVNRTAQKFRVTHEIGHRQAAATRGPSPSGYSHNDKNDAPMCKCDHVDTTNTTDIHCLQSKENIWDAAGEGYAHFWSAAIFNNRTEGSCGFGYYKEVWESPYGPPKDPTFKVNCAKYKHHLNSWCTQSTNVDKGTEWDWLTFYWNLWTKGSYKATMQEIDTIWDVSNNRWSGWNSKAWQTFYGKGTTFGQNQYNNWLTVASDAGVVH